MYTIHIEGKKQTGNFGTLEDAVSRAIILASASFVPIIIKCDGERRAIVATDGSWSLL